MILCAPSAMWTYRPLRSTVLYAEKGFIPVLIPYHQYLDIINDILNKELHSFYFALANLVADSDC